MSNIKTELTHDIINGIASSYKESLQNKFPQYQFSLCNGISTNDKPLERRQRWTAMIVTFITEHICTLLVWKDSDIHKPCTWGNGKIILGAEFSSSSIKITCFKDAMESVDTIDYFDPRFTEDILSDRLAAYDIDIDVFMSTDTAEIATDVTEYYG